jgi:hypothetical protein
MKKLVALSLALSAAACVDGEPETGTDTASIGPLEGKQNNGPYLLGPHPDSLGAAGNRHLRVKRDAMRLGTAVTVDAHQNNLVSGTHTGDDPWFEQVIFHEAGTGTGRLKVADTLATAFGWQTLYRLDYRPAPGLTYSWTPYCDGDGWAVPIAGAYAADDVRQPDDTITFACLDGAAGKCSAFGFRPAGKITDRNWLEHQACVQSVEADYCGAGIPHTFAGTDIYLRDLSTGGAPELTEADLVFPPMTPRTPLPGVPYFEAAWLPPSKISPPGQAPIMDSGPPLCLSKLRWQALPPGADCSIDDPRTNPDARFCDDMTIAELWTSAAVVFTKSDFTDRGLWLWKSGAGYMTTVDGYWQPAEPAGTIPPHPGFGDPEIVGVLLREVPPGYTMADLREVRQWRAGGPERFALAIAPPDPTYGPFGGFEGFVFAAAQPNTVALERYSNGTDSFTSTGGAPLGFSYVETLGWVYAP